MAILLASATSRAGHARAVLVRHRLNIFCLIVILLGFCFGGGIAVAASSEALLAELDPGKTRLRDAVQVLGAPDVDSASYVIAGDIDPFAGFISLTRLGKLHDWAAANHGEVIRVRILEWRRVGQHERVKLVFDREVLWYAVIIAGDNGSAHEQLRQGYGRPSEAEIRWRRIADVVLTVRFMHYPHRGVTLLGGSDYVLYPPADQVPPIATACCPAKIDNEYLGIKPGSSEQDVRATLGQPGRIVAEVAVGNVRGLKLLEYPGRRLSVFLQGGRVALVTFVSREGAGFPLQIGHWKEGLNSNLGRQEELLPSIHGRDAYGQDTVLHLFANAGIAAHADSKGRVQLIELFAPRDAAAYRGSYYREPPPGLH